MTFCGTCNTWVQASSIAQPWGTPNVCGHSLGTASLEAPTRQQDMWTTLLRRPAGYGAQYIVEEVNAEDFIRQRSDQLPVDGVGCLRPEPVPKEDARVPLSDPVVARPQQTDAEPAAAPILNADLVRCRSCKKGYRWPMEASRTDEHHLCLRCEYKEGL